MRKRFIRRATHIVIEHDHPVQQINGQIGQGARAISEAPPAGPVVLPDVTYQLGVQEQPERVGEPPQLLRADDLHVLLHLVVDELAVEEGHPLEQQRGEDAPRRPHVHRVRVPRAAEH